MESELVKADLSVITILPKVSVDGVAKVGLMQSSALNAKVVSLIKEHNRFPALTKNLELEYLTASELLSRLRYDRYIQSLDIRDRKFIIAHNIPSGVVAFRLHQRFRIPYLIYMHDPRYSVIPGTWPKFKQEEIKQSLDGAKTILTNSNKTARELNELYSVRASPLYPGCVSAPEVDGINENSILYVHSIGRGKHFDARLLFQLMERNRQIKLIVAGARRYAWQVVYIKFKTKFGNRVQFVFNPTEEELSILYRRSKVLIHPAIENFGLSPLEAAGQGTASIVAKGSGILEVLKEGSEILSFDGSIEDLHSVLLAYTDTRLKEIGTNAWKRAREFDWQVHTKLLEEQIIRQ